MTKLLNSTSLGRHRPLQIMQRRKSGTESSSEPLSHWTHIQDTFSQRGDGDVDFWWRTTGRAFAALLAQADYSPESQYRNLLFFYLVVCPELGPGPARHGGPSHWYSFMTDHFSPVELSWEWAVGGGGSGGKDGNGVSQLTSSSSRVASPTVRFSTEPIGPWPARHKTR